MLFFKLMLAFSPWLAFFVIAHGSLLRLQIGLVVALVLSTSWVSLACTGVSFCGRVCSFFASATLAVVVFENLWVVHYMGIIAFSVLAVATWLTVLLKKPFTLDYANNTPPQPSGPVPPLSDEHGPDLGMGRGLHGQRLVRLGKMEHFLCPNWVTKSSAMPY